MSNKLLKTLKIKRRKFTKNLFTRSSDWICLAEDAEIDLGGFNNQVDYCDIDKTYDWYNEGSINIINDFNNVRTL